MHSEQLLRSTSFKITLVVCLGHAILIVLMTAITDHRAESSAILYGEFVERESNVVHKSVTSPINAKQHLTNQLDVTMTESGKIAVAPQQQESSSIHVSSAPISLPSATDPSLNNSKPPYPITSREIGEEGRVWLSLCVSEHGYVSRLQLAQSSGHPALDRSAINTVTHWKFHPATQNGAAIPYCYRLPILFVLT